MPVTTRSSKSKESSIKSISNQATPHRRPQITESVTSLAIDEYNERNQNSAGNRNNGSRDSASSYLVEESHQDGFSTDDSVDIVSGRSPSSEEVEDDRSESTYSGVSTQGTEESASDLAGESMVEIPDPEVHFLTMRVHDTQNSKECTMQRFQVRSDMDLRELERFVAKVACADGKSDELPNAIGLYRKSDGLIFPLRQLLSHPEEYTGDIISVSPFKEISRGQDLFSKPHIIVLFLTLLATFFFSLLTGKNCPSFSYIFGSICNVFDVYCVNYPLVWVYRNGPSVIGCWRGLPLTEICAQKHAHLDFDIDFWSQNVGKCETMYKQMERGMLGFTKPPLYILFAYAIYNEIKKFIEFWARNKPDPDMVHVYRSLNVLARHFSRMRDDR